MSPFLTCEGATLLVSTNGGKKHLYIVLNNPKKPSDEVLIVSVETNRQGQLYNQDTTCPLMKGDHPFICRDSLVSYRHTRLVQAQQIENGIAQGHFIDKGKMDEGVLLQVCDGLLASPHTVPKYKEFYLSTQK